ncbi:23S rRNA (pseudouridine(1915)-N(3))-methyltransferase RlmH [Dolosicoccus paucivorans]|uniref:Ribosomal RNA large subunit methyltransferase H n=1 Tax=Dolosicoccus paucivorans TaxID=84521 RepID=A0A1G8MVD7_9LACT|nr:23S rRNA (pseudouridine(1915)-N(3))-methyltransferase RlmH [Dolosicoccus paucivorans]PMB84823.1 23S rRNA (pseudouridine(1915)-N(3))-methyltransferase RlmH [Dolosicoccus paucivorans]PMC58535.1 23S rRNA (pseudouridine(1915)-N(3))-methyltransferase RlmH [Dolosicoccus paucivorans]SDI71961.1 23S rRNA (pseudouridine1915-N3)-methyltransferase [Dolosicoccus paucivorans]
MNITIISVGKIKENYLKKGINEYLKRLNPYAKVNIVEVPDEATKENMTQVEIDHVLNKEADRIMAKLKPGTAIVPLAIEGDLITSPDLANQLNQYATYGKSHVTFIIGGSLGLSQSIKKKADRNISFGRITLPHQLMRLVLVEQIYRAFRIINGHAYHK